MKFSFCYSLSRCIAIALCLLYVGVSRASVVGTSGGSAGVNQLGAATYTLPIEVPKGVNGLQPNLSITYNSMYGNGALGMGFSLEGLSVITRTTKTIYYDYVSRGVNSGAFALDGQRLIEKSSTEYVLENDPQMKIMKVTEGSNIYFQALLPDGRTITYGKSASCRTVSNYAWYIERVEDAYGNYLIYNYYSYDDTRTTTTSRTNAYDNTKYITAITYGKNTNQSNPLMCVVSFLYEDRPDILLGYVGASICKTGKRLSKISCSVSGSGEGSAYRSYELKYANTDAYSRLTEIIISGSGNTFEPIKFNWSVYPNGQSYSCGTFDINNEHKSSFNNGTYSASDVNGDGKSDIVAIENHSGEYLTLAVYKNTTISNSQELSFDKLLDKRFDGVNYPFMQFIDLTGDGNKQLVWTRNFANWYTCDFEEVKKGTDSHFIISIEGVDRELFQTELYKTGQMKDNERPIFACADLDCNGTTEIIMMERYSTAKGGVSIISYNPSTKKYVVNKTILNVPEIPQQLLIADFNNDGMADMMVLYKTGYKIFKYNGADLSTVTGNIFSDYISDTTIKYEQGKYVLQAGDFNGDGQVDIIYNKKGSYDWYIATNNANGEFTTSKAIIVTDICDRDFTDKDDDKFQCIVLDYNFDGKDDAILVKSEYKYHSSWGSKWGEYRKTYYQWLASNGDGTLIKERELTSDVDDHAKSGLIITGDFFGNGFPTIVNYGANLFETNGQATNKDMKWWFYGNRFLTPSTSKLVSVKDELGNISQFTYETLTNSSIYSKEEDAQYPIIDIVAPYHVVYSIYNTGGDVKKYSYSGLKAHLQGRGMLGFEKMVENNTTQGVTTETKVTAWNSTFYLPSTTTTTTKVGSTAVSTVQQTVTYKQTSGKRYVVSGTVTKSIDMYGNTTTETVTNNATYGYPTEDKVTYSDGSYVSTVYSDYALVNGYYRAKTITNNRKHADDSSVFSQKKQYTFNTTGTIASEAEAGITTAYTYNSFGNIATKTVSGSGITAVKHTYTYDTYNRFVTKDENNTTGTYSAYTYSITGNLLTSQTPLTTKRTYDNFGRIKTETDPYGIVSSISYGWGSTTDKKYYVKTVTDAAPTVTVWYDYLGREVEKNTTGEGGITITTKTKYNSKGQVSQVFYTEGDKESSMTYTYDTYGRISKEESSIGSVVSYSYGNKTATVNDNGRSTTKTFDAMGNVKKVTDPISSVTYTYASNGQPKVASSAGASYTMTYDSYGRRTSLTDPNAGKTTYEYDVLGRVVKQTDGRSNVSTWTYDAGGRVTKEVCGAISTSFTYGTTNATYGNVTQIARTDGTESYVYDSYNRVTKKTKVTTGKSFVTSYAYNTKNQILSETKPNGDVVSYGYDGNGFISSILLNGEIVWQLTSNSGLAREYNLYSSLTGSTKYRSNNTLQSKAIYKSGTEVKSDLWNFDPKTGNLTYRQITPGQGGATEYFTYDKLDRMTSNYVIYHGNGSKVSENTVSYASNGNILTKDDVGTYTYSSTRPHAVSSVDVDNTSARSVGQQKLTYNAYNKVSTVSESNIERAFLNLESTYSNATYDASLAITYGTDNERAKSEYSITDRSTSKVVRKETRYYDGNYEEVVKQLYDPKTGSLLSTTTNKLTYVTSPDGLVLVKIDGNKYCAFTDYLGSIESLVDKNGTIVFSASYDAWGKQTISKRATGLESFRRGYTGHEHLAEFGLINMNGRIYDPVLGRFLSPDPVMQAPDFSQNYNGYSYCFNNPMKFTDPSGKFAISGSFIASIIVGGLISWGTASAMSNGGLSDTGAIKSFVVGAVGGAVGSVVGSMVSAGMGFVGGFASGAAAGGAGGVASSLTSSILYGNTFGGSIVNAFSAALTGAVIGGLIGGVTNGISAVKHHGKFWDGDGCTFDQVAAISTTDKKDITIGDGMEYSNEYAKEFSEEHFFDVKGVNELHADDSFPEGYRIENGRVYNTSNQEVCGSSVYHSDTKMSDVYLYRVAFSSKEKLFMEMAHEYMHAGFSYNGLTNTDAQHASIYKWQNHFAKQYKLGGSYSYKYNMYKQHYNNTYDVSKLFGMVNLI